MRWSGLSHLAARRELWMASVVLGGAMAWSQNPPPNSADQQARLAQSVHELEAQVKELRSAVVELRSAAAQYHAQTLELRHELQLARGQASTGELHVSETTLMTPSGSTSSGESENRSATSVVSGQSTQEHPPTSDEQIQLLSGKVDEQYQTKVESASKYRVRLSGIVLLNLFTNRGVVDNADFPHLVLDPIFGTSRGSFGASLRQSMLGLEAFGPELAGAKTSADIQFDFAGGFPQTQNGVTFGLVRLRTATLHMDWARTSVVAGQDALFFAPLSPTSLASLAVPALSYTGSLWSWTPQVRMEHRVKLSPDSTITLQAGILDPLTGEVPASSPLYANGQLFASQFYRTPQAGEASNQPGVGVRAAWGTHLFGQPFTVGAGGYYSRQNWALGRTVDGWAGTTDLTLPLGRWFTLTGEFYRGRAIGGLGGATGRSVLFTGPMNDPASVVRGLDDIGGWSQLKFKASEKLELNAAVGQDSPFAGQVRAFSALSSYFDLVTRNRGGFVNFIYHPRSDLLFSAEYRRMRTDTIYWSDAGNHDAGNHVNLMMGILF